MAKTILRLLDNYGSPLADEIIVTMYGPLEGTPSSRVSTKIPTQGNHNGTRVFLDLPAGSYNLLYDGNIQSELSPMYIAGAVTGFSINVDPGSIENSDLADNSISSQKIINGAVTESKLLDNSVTSNKIRDGAVTESKLLNNSVSKNKLSNNIFNTQMIDSSGWGPKLDNATLEFNSNGEIKVKDQGITSNQLATNIIGENSINSNNIVDGAITNSKLGTASVKGVNIDFNEINSDHIQNEMILYNHINPAAIAQLRADVGNIPSDIAYVSPHYTGAPAPFFTLIQDAIDYLKYINSEGTVYIYPGVYAQSITLDSSISLVGADKSRCIILAAPSASQPQSLLINGIGSSNISIKNLTFKCMSDNLVNITSYGISVEAVNLSYLVSISDCDIVSLGRSSSTGNSAVGVKVDASNVNVINCFIQSTGGNGSSGAGGNAMGILLHTFHSGGLFNMSGTRIKTIPGAGSPIGKGYGVYNADVSWVYPNSDTPGLVLTRVTHEGDDFIKSVSSQIAPTVISCDYKTAVDTNIVSTAFIGSNQNSAIKVISEV